jgi:broad specificity phosphatase PhoE
MLRVLLVRPGSTDLDDQRRIKGTLDVPLSLQGAVQVARAVEELAGVEIDAIYSAPAICCRQTATALADTRRVKVKRIDGLHNLDHGLWHGKLIDEVRQTQPKVYRQWQENPESVCPPDGESLPAARKRVAAALVKLIKKHKDGVIAVVASEPLASICRSVLSDSDLGDLWKAECDCGRWEVIDVESPRLSGHHSYG